MAMKIKVRFHGVDYWNRPIFRSVSKPYRFYGSTYWLFDYDAEEDKVVKFFKDSPECLYYFGRHFGCEPLGSEVLDKNGKSKLLIEYN